MHSSQSTRRRFITDLTAAGTALMLSRPIPLNAMNTDNRRPVCVFSKAFQELNYEEAADLVAEVGWDGIECPVRKGGQVLPERVEDDLPKLVAALKKRGKSVQILATDIQGVKTPLCEKVLSMASRLGIRYYRLGNFNYSETKSIPDQLQTLRSQLAELAALNRQLNLCAGFQNHSGAGRIGAAVWDIYEVIRDIDPRHLGVCFDIGHATVEGGNAWPTHARLMEPYYAAVYVKDFTWQKTDKGWTVQWCPLGEGMIQRRFFERLQTSQFRGPISQHYEFELGTGPARIAALKRDLGRLKEWLAPRQ